MKLALFKAELAQGHINGVFSFSRFPYLNFTRQCFLPECTHGNVYAWGPWKSEECVRSPELVTDGSESLCGCWELNLVPLQQE